MTRLYSPKTFLRQVPNYLLEEFFDRKGQLSQIDWASHRETQVGLIYDAWQALPAEERAEVEGAFQSVHEMACEAGVRALVEEGMFHGANLSAELDQLDGFYHKAMYAYLRHERIFGIASYFHSADSLPQRYWLRHKALPRKAPDTSDAAVELLAARLSEFYRDTQGRGHRCTVETYPRGGRQHYFFAYPDDYTDTYIGHNEEGQFVKRPQKRAFENVFVYDPQRGTLDLYAQGDRVVKAHLTYIFSIVVLKENPPPEQPGDHPFELNGLRSRSFAFDADPRDGIAEVRVTKMRLSIGDGRRRITLEADPRAERGDLYDLMDEFLDAGRLARAAVNVTQAQFQFRFVPKAGEQPKPLSFNVSFPNASNLKSLPEEQRLLVEKYLKRWGIDRG
jgi:hypothetical protein